MKLATDDPQLIVRKARKAHFCHECWKNEPEWRRSTLKPTIEPGDTYIEYVGGSPAYQSGYRYCAPHAVSVWGVTETT